MKNIPLRYSFAAGVRLAVLMIRGEHCRVTGADKGEHELLKSDGQHQLAQLFGKKLFGKSGKMKHSSARSFPDRKLRS